MLSCSRPFTADAGQGHVFAHWDKCTPSERDALVSQLSRIDLARVRSVFARSLADHRAGTSSRGTIEPVKAHESVLGADPSKLQRWRERGLQAAAEGQLAVVLLAGGQGTRLGSSDPKGMYDIGLPSGRTLFRLHAERLLKLGRMAAAQAQAQGQQVQVRIPWYIMTSPFTHDATVRKLGGVVGASLCVNCSCKLSDRLFAHRLFAHIFFVHKLFAHRLFARLEVRVRYSRGHCWCRITRWSGNRDGTAESDYPSEEAGGFSPRIHNSTKKKCT